MPISALAVHQLRYYVAFGSRAPEHLARDGHAYLSTIEPFVLLCVALAIGALIGRLAASWRQPATGSAPPFVRVWTVCALTLFAIYCGQELFEGLFAVGHPAGMAGVLGHGGWIALPAALAIGAALALALRVAERLVAFVGRLAARRRPAPAPPHARSAPHRLDWRLAPLAGITGSRAPPWALSHS
jgi:hypothetical protein